MYLKTGSVVNNGGFKETIFIGGLFICVAATYIVSNTVVTLVSRHALLIELECYSGIEPTQPCVDVCLRGG